jgi:Bacterial protein of unknown function (DUF885)
MPEASAVDHLVDRFLTHHAAFFPVDATFMGMAGADHRLPPAHAGAGSEESQGLAEMDRALDAVGPGADAGGRLDIRLMRAAILHARMANTSRPRFMQPSWYAGEVAFGVISLLLPSGPPAASEALHARLRAAPRFLDEGIAALSGQPLPPDWVTRTTRECDAIQRLLAIGLRRHPLWSPALEEPCREACAAVSRFHDALPGRPPADVLAILMRDVHGLPWSPEEAVDMAGEAFVRLGEEIAAHERRGGGHPGPDQLLVAPADLPRAYREQHEGAMARAGGLVTPAADYALSFAPLPDWARDIAGELYFLSYRSPPALRPGGGSTYWTAPVGQTPVAIKQTHAVHHGSIGHHTQNARARVAASRLARLGGTDCASGIACLSSGTMVEGWSCYATELMAEVDGFYTPEERIAQLRAERRNAASVIADIKLHTGEWPLARMRAFYADEAGFPAARIWSETTRNSILPATRLMYFLGVEQIKALRREIGGPARAFHDELLSHGHAPVAWLAEEMQRRRAQRPSC